MTNRVLLLSNPGELKEELVLTTSFCWVALSGSNIVQDYVRIDHKPVLVQDRLKGVNNPELLLFCVSDLFNTAGVNRSEVSLQKLREHPEAKVAFNQYLLDLVLLSDQRELFKVWLAITAPKATASKEEKISVEVCNYRSCS